MQSDQSPGAPGAKAVFSVKVPIRWGDLDAQNHLSNVVYFRLFEEARIHVLNRMRTADPDARRMNMLAHASCDYLRPVYYPATLRIDHTLNRIGRTSLDFSLEMRCADNPDVLYARGRYVLVGADLETGRPVPWSGLQLEELRSTFNIAET